MLQSPSEDRQRLPNPFGRLVGDPMTDYVDVAEINRRAFEACQRLILEVKEQSASGALTLVGAAGAGKTHLLGRVRRWLQGYSDSLFVPVRMDTNAQMIWRHLRRNLADALLRPDQSGDRPIGRLLKPRSANLDQLAERDLGIVLDHLLRGSHFRDTAAWLRGQDLPESVLERLTLAQPGPDENQEMNSRNVVVSLCSLLEPATVVFCLDQWEALQSYTGDNNGLQAAGQAISVLHDPPVRNASIVCCLQTELLARLENALDLAIQHRMLGRREAIELLDWEKARSLVSAFLDSSPDLSALRQPHDNVLWPLTEKPIREVFRDAQAPARKVISRCKDLFDLWRIGDMQAKVPLNDALQTMLEARSTEVPQADAEAALLNGLPLLFQARGYSMAPSTGTPFHFVSSATGNAISVCNEVNATSLAARLKRIRDAWRPTRDERLLLLRDARLPIGPRAIATQQRLTEIQKKGGALVPVSREAIGALAALRRLLADAQSGDLAHDGDPIPPKTVEAWIADHLPEVISNLADELGAPHRISAGLAALLARVRMISLEEAARELKARPEEVESCARRDPRLFGMLGGATPVLFQPFYSEPRAS